MTNILKNLKILLNKHFSLLLIIILILNLSYNLFFRYNYLIPYGWDEIITIWPVGNELLKANLVNWPNILFSRFLSEDHLFPVTNFFTYFICKLNGNIIENLYWVSRLCYIIILALSITLIKNIGFTKANIFYFIIIFLNAGPINFSILSYNLNFNLVCIFSLLSTIFFLKAQEKEFKNYNTLSTLDLIEYGYEFSDYPKNLKFRFDSIDEVPSQSNSSKFPNGYVKNKLVDVYNLLSLINEKSKYNFRNNWSTFEFELNDDMLEIINYESDSYYNNSKLISILKDNLDGNIYENKEINLMVI